MLSHCERLLDCHTSQFNQLTMHDIVVIQIARRETQSM
ncbi:hypothetical protein DDI_0535 [Dickeya dianthicola RNS04.9]|nr:hypothetical protein DDI_0535 [Dickeya dianthicola RNS04.9]